MPVTLMKIQLKIPKEAEKSGPESIVSLETLEHKWLLSHRIIEWFGLEGTLQIILFQPPCHGQGHLPLDQVAQSSI